MTERTPRPGDGDPLARLDFEIFLDEDERQMEIVLKGVPPYRARWVEAAGAWEVVDRSGRPALLYRDRRAVFPEREDVDLVLRGMPRDAATARAERASTAAAAKEIATRRNGPPLSRRLRRDPLFGRR